MRLLGIELTREGMKDAMHRLNVWLAGSPHEADAPCSVPPPGWFCTRMKGHPGPCAAYPFDKAESCRHGYIGRCPFCARDSTDPGPSR